jgi:hypothetical protein
MRVFARRERPHPGAQLTLFEAGDGWRYSLWATNRPAGTKGWLGQAAYIDVAHRVQARVEDAILPRGLADLLRDVALVRHTAGSATDLHGCGARGW